MWWKYNYHWVVWLVTTLKWQPKMSCVCSDLRAVLNIHSLALHSHCKVLSMRWELMIDSRDWLRQQGGEGLQVSKHLNIWVEMCVRMSVRHLAMMGPSTVCCKVVCRSSREEHCWRKHKSCLLFKSSCLVKSTQQSQLKFLQCLKS